MKCNEICALIEQEYGTEYACDWDKLDYWPAAVQKEVKKILFEPGRHRRSGSHGSRRWI